ncbi:MAG TPA: adenylyl-sulfate kinase [Mycobacteriales bacterium]|nr:adenylyl-sulfate kinase [Mycobacteriales bacterium]
MTTATIPRADPTTVAAPTERGATVWMTGLPSAGKSSVAEGLADRLRADGHRVEVLDGNVVREFLSRGLGFSRTDRDANILRIGFVADLLARNGVKAICASIAPYDEIRRQVRAMHDTSGTAFLQVYVATPVDVCSERDVRGLYAAQRAGELTGLTGVDDPYEVPADSEVVLPTEAQTLAESVAAVHAALVERGLA